MKKLCIVLGLVVGVFVTPLSVDAGFDLSSAWKQWILMRKAVNHQVSKPETNNRLNSVLKHRYSNSSYRQNSSISREPRLRAQILAVRPRKAIHEITEQAIKIFEVGVRLDAKKDSSTYQESVILGKAKFKLFKNRGIAADVRGFVLVVKGEEFNFQGDGTVIVPLSQVRLSRGKNFTFDVNLRVKDSLMTPHVRGELLLRMEEITAYGETSDKKMIGHMYGSLVSHKLIFDPVPYINPGYNSNVEFNEYTTIYGKTLEEGEKALVLIGKFSANYDDLYLREVTLRNTLTGSNIDPLIDEIKAIDLKTGAVLDTARFTAGEANLRFSPNVFVGRGDQVRIGFQIEVEDPLNHTALDARFQLGLEPEDLVVQSVTTGNMLPDSAKHFSIESEEFVIAQGKMAVSPSAQQHPFAVGTNRPETVFRFTIGGGESELGRVSLDAYLGGLEFMDGSLSGDDVELVRIVGNREYDQSVTVDASGNKITLDFITPFIKSKDEIIEFGLKLALDNLSGSNVTDLVSVRILDDVVYQQGTLFDVRATGANFVWSDRSARNHSVTTSDWGSGYLVSGLPSNTTVVKRFGD